MSNSKNASASSASAVATQIIAGHAITDAQGAATALVNATPGSLLHQRIMEISATFDKNDIIELAKTNEEERIHAAQINGQRELDQLNTQQRKLKAAFDAIGPKLIAGIDTTADQVVVKALSEADYGKFKIEVTAAGTEEKARKWSFQVAIKEAKSAYSSTTHSRAVTIPFTAEATSLLKQLANTLDDINQVQVDLVHLKQERSNLPAFGRRVQAKMTRCAIAKMAEGEQLLEQIGTVRSLPLLTSGN